VQRIRLREGLEDQQIKGSLQVIFRHIDLCLDNWAHLELYLDN
jgi:hypothetical protein